MRNRQIHSGNWRLQHSFLIVNVQNNSKYEQHINQFDLFEVCRLLITTAKYIFSSCAVGIFIKAENILNHKTSH